MKGAANFQLAKRVATTVLVIRRFSCGAIKLKAIPCFCQFYRAALHRVRSFREIRGQFNYGNSECLRCDTAGRKKVGRCSHVCGKKRYIRNRARNFSYFSFFFLCSAKLGKHNIVS